MGAAVVALAVLLAAADALRPAAPVEARPEVGHPAPDFELATLDGGTIRLSELRGRVVFLNFWATWCWPCRTEMPEIQRLHRAGIRDLVIVGVNQTFTETSPQHVLSFMEQNGFDWTVALDTDADATIAYRAFRIPASYFIDRDGIIRARYEGPLTFGTMRAAVLRAGEGR